MHATFRAELFFLSFIDIRLLYKGICLGIQVKLKLCIQQSNNRSV